jgi:uncharacterized protein (DUF427 family)
VTEPNRKPLEDIDVGPPTDAPLTIEPSDRWVRAVVNGVTVVNSKHVRLVREPRRLPFYAFPAEDVRMDLLSPSGRTRASADKQAATYLTLTAGDRTIPDAAWAYEAQDEEASGLKGLVAFYWQRMDHWYEEDDEVYVHPRDPRHRVDVMNSSRHVKVVLNGQVIAETTQPRLLFETGLPTRYYIPHQHVRMDLLVPSPTQSQCPYKGVAKYWSVRVGNGMLAKDMAWAYPFPIAESAKIENLIAFFNERVDAIVVDGEDVPKPNTPWSGPAELVKETKET